MSYFSKAQVKGIIKGQMTTPETLGFFLQWHHNY